MSVMGDSVWGELVIWSYGLWDEDMMTVVYSGSGH